MIDGDEVRRINPHLSHEVTVASWCPTDGHANPLTTTLGFYKMARRLGRAVYHRGACDGASDSKRKNQKGDHAE